MNPISPDFHSPMERAVPELASPKIALIFDHHHQDPHEKAISNALCKIDPLKNIIFFCENRVIETPSLNQYSCELLGKEKNSSTAASAMLLITHILMGSGIESKARDLIGWIYCDPYFKMLFSGQYYTKYHPNKCGLPREVSWTPFNELNRAPRQCATIKAVENFFAFLDKELPKQLPHEQEFFFLREINSFVSKILESDLWDIHIFGPISEALTFLKIQEVHKKLTKSGLDSSKEIPLSIINQLYGDATSTGTLLLELNTTFRTQFQASKVISVVEKILKEQIPNDPIFVVHLGIAHKAIAPLLMNHFQGRAVIKDFTLTEEDLPQVENKIRAQFA